MGFWLSLIVYTFCFLLAALAYIIWDATPRPDQSATTGETDMTEKRKGYELPPEALAPPEISLRSYMYAEFYEKAFCVNHRDGKSVIVLMPTEDDWMTYGEKMGWPTLKLQMVYERLHGEDHPRVVRYVGQLDDGSVVLEKLSPGPLRQIKGPEHIDHLTRALYYSWALQTLSALSFLHSHGITTRGFGEQNVWLRSDFTIALTGLINSFIDGKQADNFEGVDGCSWIGYDDWNYGYENSDYGDSGGTRREDLYYWGRWVFFLLAPNADEEIESPAQFSERYDQLDTWKARQEALRNEMLECLGEDPIGPILWKTWTSEYATAEDVAEDVKKCATKIGLQVVGQDEIDVGKPWEDVFEIVWGGDKYRNFTLRLKK